LFDLFWTEGARENYRQLKSDPSQKVPFRAVRKTLQLLAQNPRHNSLETHEFQTLHGPNNEKVFEAYAQQHTPAAFRVFWYYGPDRGAITILAITSYP
jgi:hypothetical protein